MAIVVDEQKTSAGIGVATFVVWIALLVFMGWGAYYVFFSNPEVVLPEISEKDRENSQFATIKLDKMQPLLDKLKNPNLFRAPVLVPPANPSGRTNPFIAP